MKTIKQRIIEEWNKTLVVHPSYRSIAKKVGKDHAYVFRVIKEHQNEKQKNGKGKNLQLSVPKVHPSGSSGKDQS